MRRGLTRQELGDMLHVSESTIRRLEENPCRVDNSQLNKLLDICIVLHCRLENILESNEIIKKLKHTYAINEDTDILEDVYHTQFDGERLLYERYFKLEPQSLSADQKNTIQYFLNDFPERWKQALGRRYSHRLRFSQIAEIMGIGSARVRQLINLALQKLLEIDKSVYIGHGFPGYHCEIGVDEVQQSFEEIPISDLQLCSHAYNCLMRTGLDTVEKIRMMGIEQFRTLKSMNDEAASDTYHKLQKFLAENYLHNKL